MSYHICPWYEQNNYLLKDHINYCINIKGGPGSGKITHCETQTRELNNWVHICMTEAMNQMLEQDENKNTNTLTTRQVILASDWLIQYNTDL